MNSDTISPRDRANKGYSLVLQRMAHGTAKTIAADMGISDSTLSDIKNKQTEQVLLLLAHLGLKVVPANVKCLDPVAYEFLTAMHARIVAQAPQLVWEEAE